MIITKEDTSSLKLKKTKNSISSKKEIEYLKQGIEYPDLIYTAHPNSVQERAPSSRRFWRLYFSTTLGGALKPI